jgi:hypothetical protein
MVPSVDLGFAVARVPAGTHVCHIYNDAGRPGARVIGEMPPDIAEIPGGTRLLEYEARVNSLLRAHPVTAVCQYDAHAFGGADCMDVLTVHPMMLVRGAVVLNPFFIPPEEFLRR